ncbi:MauE/DoxX family redox-associated membrane protein [Streptomyces sp. NPDC055025]
MRNLATGCEFLLGVVFLAAALSKSRNRYSFLEFVGSIKDLNILPRSRARAMAMTALGVEFTVPVLLAFSLLPVGPLREEAPVLRTGALALSLGLLLVFSSVVAHALRSGTQTPCKCFGGRGAVLGVRHIVRNLLLSTIAIVGMLGNLLAGESAEAVFGKLLAAATGIVLASFFVLFDDIVELFIPTRSTGSPKGPRLPVSQIRDPRG